MQKIKLGLLSVLFSTLFFKVCYSNYSLFDLIKTRFITNNHLDSNRHIILGKLIDSVAVRKGVRVKVLKTFLNTGLPVADTITIWGEEVSNPNDKRICSDCPGYHNLQNISGFKGRTLYFVIYDFANKNGQITEAYVSSFSAVFNSVINDSVYSLTSKVNKSKIPVFWITDIPTYEYYLSQLLHGSKFILKKGKNANKITFIPNKAYDNYKKFAHLKTKVSLYEGQKGKLVLQKELKPKEYIDITFLPTGTYYLYEESTSFFIGEVKKE